MIRALGDDGFASMRRYVKRGGRYFGSCAGGYLAARRIVFESPDLHTQADRPLGFYPGTASGPLPDLSPPFRDDPAVASVVDLTTTDGRRLPTLYWGGFELRPDDGAEVETLATYTGERLAAARVASGDGTVVLCGCHPEVSGDALATLPGHEANAAATLRERDTERRELFRLLWKSLMTH
jgi:glutamine amidotransferase-like uncharacterized protein